VACAVTGVYTSTRAEESDDQACRDNARSGMPFIAVTGLHTYPIKSCAGVTLTKALVTPRGFVLDRDFMLVDDDNDFVSQRKVPELALVRPAMRTSTITLTAPGIESVEIALESEPDDTRLITATVHGRPVTGQLMAEDLSEWFTTFLPAYKGNRRFRLLRVREDVPSYIRDRYHKDGASNQVGFADGNSMLLASEASLAALNTQLDDAVPMSRFRPNIVVGADGLAPYDEDYWRHVQIGDLSAFVVKGCDRCSIPDTDQETATVGKAVRVALKTRKGVNAHDGSNKGVFFAQNLNHVYAPGAAVRLGDAVRVLARSQEPNVVLERR
jgi:uncharacterized protein YcbX